MEEINEKLHIKLLDFQQGQWKEWVTERKPFSALFELTPKCNMNCIHCYLQHQHSSEELSFGEIVSILDVLYDKGILFLVLTGGEILTRSDFVDIYMYAKKKGFLIELFSNGFLFTDDIILMLKRYPPLYIDITLYGACEETYNKVTNISGAFDRVIDNCKKIKEAGINLSLRSPIIEETVDEMDEMKAIADELHVPFVCTFEICPTIDKDESPLCHQVDLSTKLKYEFDNYYEQINNGERKDGATSEEVLESLNNNCVFSCNVAMNSFVIDYEGKMCPCMKLKHRGVKLLDNEFDNIWKGFSVYSRMKASDSYKCRHCKARYYCDVCPAEMDLLFDDYEYRNSDMCKMAKLREAFYRKEKTYKEVLGCAACHN